MPWTSSRLFKIEFAQLSLGRRVMPTVEFVTLHSWLKSGHCSGFHPWKVWCGSEKRESWALGIWYTLKFFREWVRWPTSSNGHLVYQQSIWCAIVYDPEVSQWSVPCVRFHFSPVRQWFELRGGVDSYSILVGPTIKIYHLCFSFSVVERSADWGHLGVRVGHAE